MIPAQAGVPQMMENCLGHARPCATLTGAMASETNVLDAALDRARVGDEAGFLELWRSLQPPLLRYLRVLGCDDPDDVASETWLQVVRDLHRFRGAAEDFRRWLFTIGRHRAIDAARAKSRRPASPTTSGLDAVADRELVEEQVLDGMSVRGAIALLARLSRDQAEAVALRVIAGLDTPDVAKILGKSTGAVRVALHRGLRVLADDPDVQALAAEPTGGTGPRSPGPGSGQATRPSFSTLGEVDY
jgi:RNA polymerase sigma-70 factor, ECF subfamily